MPASQQLRETVLAAASDAEELVRQGVPRFNVQGRPLVSIDAAKRHVEALGGPTTYSDSYGGETSLVRIHSGNGAHEDMDRRAITCFDQVLIDAGLDGDDQLRRVLHDYFAWATTTTIARYHHSAEDDGLGIPRRSWDGLLSGAAPEGG